MPQEAAPWSVQTPQFKVPPQPSEIEPQVLPWAAQVVGVQPLTHLPPTQPYPALQTTPQAPQLLVVVRLAHVPLPQQLCPLGHVPQLPPQPSGPQGVPLLLQWGVQAATQKPPVQE